jgi:hypothetical protein
MATGYKRLTRKARHIIRHLKRTKHASVQDQMIHELRHEVSRTHGFKGPGKAPGAGNAGHWRPLTHKAKQMLTRLRKAKVWSVQKQLVNELAREMERGKRVADRARARTQAAAKRVRAGAARTRQAGSRFRATVNRGQERVLTRAERKQAEREKPALPSRQPYAGPFRSRRAHRRWGRQNARREVPGMFARFAARRGWTRLQSGHRFTPAARAAEARSQRRMTARPARRQAPRPARPPRPRPARTR